MVHLTPKLDTNINLPHLQMEKYLIIGNMGYVGSVLVKHLRLQEPDAFLIGYDLEIFSHCLSSVDQIPESYLDIQYFGDARSFDRKVLNGCDGVVYLAAISNDPMGKMYESLTDEVNYRSCIRWAEAAKDAENLYKESRR